MHTDWPKSRTVWKTSSCSSVIVYFLLFVRSKYSSKNFVHIHFSSTILLQWKKSRFNFSRIKRNTKSCFSLFSTSYFQTVGGKEKVNVRNRNKNFPSFNLLKILCKCNLCMLVFRSRIFATFWIYLLANSRYDCI
jgi:hypothetical protein